MDPGTRKAIEDIIRGNAPPASGNTMKVIETPIGLVEVRIASVYPMLDSKGKEALHTHHGTTGIKFVGQEFIIFKLGNEEIAQYKIVTIPVDSDVKYRMS